MQKYQTLSSKIVRSVSFKAIAALALSSIVTIVVVRSKNQQFIHKVAELRMLRASTLIDPILLDEVGAASPEGIERKQDYIDLVAQLRSTIHVIPGASAQLLLINSSNVCRYIAAISETGELQRDYQFKAIVPCPKEAIASLGVKQLAIKDDRSFLRLPDGLTVYRPIRSSSITPGVLVIRFDFSRNGDTETESFIWIVLFQLPIACVVAIALQRSLSRHMERLNAIVVGLQDLACKNYEQVNSIKISQGNCDELDVLGGELKAIAKKFTSGASKKGDN